MQDVINKNKTEKNSVRALHKTRQDYVLNRETFSYVCVLDHNVKWVFKALNLPF